MILTLSPFLLASEQNAEGEAIAFYIENDSRNLGGPGSDQAYTNGLKVSYIYVENHVPAWAKKPIEKLQFIDHGLSSSKINFGLSFGHQIYSPNNIDSAELISDDRPYVGWMYIGFAMSLKKDNSGHFFELNTGLIGPSALGKQVQNNFHDLIHTHRAEGWSHSLHDEPTLELFYQKRLKYFKTTNFDFIPYYGVGLGNVLIGSHLGGLIRFGVRLPDDFGPSRPSASDGDNFISPMSQSIQSEPSYFLFAGARGNAVARNIFLDGNSFQDSHRVTKKTFLLETELGCGLQRRPFSVIWRFVNRSPEFEQQTRSNNFASINFIYMF